MEEVINGDTSILVVKFSLDGSAWFPREQLQTVYVFLFVSYIVNGCFSHDYRTIYFFI